jgi:hypothetical protein
MTEILLMLVQIPYILWLKALFTKVLSYRIFMFIYLDISGAVVLVFFPPADWNSPTSVPSSSALIRADQVRDWPLRNRSEIVPGQ